MDVFQRLGRLDDRSVIQLCVLWFVTLTFLQLEAGRSPPVMVAAELVAMVLVFAIPFAVLIHLLER
jgi:hypothetical protein